MKFIKAALVSFLFIVQGAAVTPITAPTTTTTTSTPLAVRSVIIGDSLFCSGMPFLPCSPSPLAKWLMTWAGHDIEDYALVGASLEDGWMKSIPAQYQDVRKSPPITTLIMDGGGNDAKSHEKDCRQFNNVCKEMIHNAASLARGVLQAAHEDGIRHVIYLGFYYLPGLEETVDYARKVVYEVCENAAVDCHFVDPRWNATTQTGLQTPEWLGPDKVHPTELGYKTLASMVWATKLRWNIPV